MSEIELIISGRKRDLGGFSVRRVLPYASHRMVGPFIFFDHMGPAEFRSGEGMDVRPHPHIGLTVTYLFEGKIRHRDSLGSDQLIEPGAINWMTAGRGIVHSERTPNEARKAGGRVNGIQCWVALPHEHEEVSPSFFHHAASTFSELKIDGAKVKVLVGEAFGRKSPVTIYSDLFYLEVNLPKGVRFNFPTMGREVAAYVVDGEVVIDAQNVTAYQMAVIKRGADLALEAAKPSRLVILGGSALGPRQIFWNFVSSSVEKIETAKRDWTAGPRADNPRFHPVVGDDLEFIPLPVT